MRKIIFKIIPAFIFFLLPAAGWASQPGDGDDDKAFVCVSTSQTPDTYTMETLDKITFTSSGVKVWTTAGKSKTYAFSSFRWISFGDTAPLIGDVNLDGVVDISDIVAVINFLASGEENVYSDVNFDETSDISDIVAVINIIAKQ